MRTFLTLEEAWAETLGRVRAVETEVVSLEEAYGRILAQEVRSRTPLPPFDRSALDGYAVRAEDVRGASPSESVVLEIIEEVGAGRVPELLVGKGQCSRIMTGAPIPVGADAIVRLEGTERGVQAAATADPSPSQVRIFLEVPHGEAISLKGEDAPEGVLLVEAGGRIGAAETAVLAANGEAVVRVYKRPRVGIIVSGEEVRPLEGDLAPGQIRDSNGPMLAALVRDGGGEPVRYGQVGDDLEQTAALVRQAAAECDLVLTTGGVSVGDYDLMRDAYVLAGGEVLFWKVTIRPGTPITFAELNGTPIYGLSGNPAAAFVNHVLLVVPVLKKLCGDPHPEHRPVRAVFNSSIESRVIGLDRFLRATLNVRDGVLTAEVPAHGQKAGILTTLVGTHGLVRIPARAETREGSLFDVYLLPGAGSR